MSLYTIEGDTLTAIADKIREKKYQNNIMTPEEMADELDELGYGMDIDVDESCTRESWTRPQEYPDLTVLDRTDFDGVYLTYDLRLTPGYAWIGIYINTIATATSYFERGHIESNEFVADEIFSSYSSTAYFRHDLDPQNGDIQLWRVRTNDRIRKISFCTNSATANECYMIMQQPCVERYGRLPNVADLSSSPNSTSPSGQSWITNWLLRDDVCDITQITTMSQAYYCAFNLKEVYFDGWDTSKVTTFSSCFNNCYDLEVIPISHITTDSASNLASMFSNCHRLKNININHFNINKATSLNYLFNGCRSIENIEMSELVGTEKLTNIMGMFYDCRCLKSVDVSNLNVSNTTNFTRIFLNCRKLKYINLSAWDTSNVTTFLSMFEGCSRLEVVDLSGWDVKLVTSTESMFRDCYQLKKIIGLEEWELISITTTYGMFYNCYTLDIDFKIKTWNISQLTATNAMFASCFSLKSVTLTNWDVDNIITTMDSMFYYCRRLKKIHLPNMKFTASDGVNLANFLYGCQSLEDLDLTGWRIPRILSFGAFFFNCTHLREIDLTSWVVGSGEMIAKNTLNYTFRNCSNCKSIKINFPLEIVTSGTISYMWDYLYSCEYLDIRNWDISKSTGSYTPNYNKLIDYYPPQLYPINQTYANAISLSAESLVRILEALPEVTTTKTVTLGQNNILKLTQEEIAIATEKGWTVA